MGSCTPSLEGFTSGNTSFLVMNPDVHFLRLKQWTLSCVPQVWGMFYRPVCLRVRPFWSRKCYGMGCAGICNDGRTQLKIVHGPVNAVKYKGNILNPIVVPFLQQRNCDHVFQHDNARWHVARVCQYFLNHNHSRVLPWPAFSPDMIFVNLSLYVRNIEHQIIASFLFLTSI